MTFQSFLNRMSAILDKEGEQLQRNLKETISFYYFKGELGVLMDGLDSIFRCDHDMLIPLNSLPAFYAQFYDHKTKRCHTPKNKEELKMIQEKRAEIVSKGLPKNFDEASFRGI